MKISYNWLKWYIPDGPEAEKLADIFTYHVAEVESFEKITTGPTEDFIFDIKILPNRAHDLLSHQGIAREISSLLGISYNDPTSKYKIPESKKTDLKIRVESKNCRRYMGRIVRNVKVGPSPAWVVEHLESIGQRSINNVVDSANIVMYDCGQPIHCFDLDKVEGAIVVRQARDGEEMTTLDNKKVALRNSDLVIADEKNVLAIAGVKGGKLAEVDTNTKNIIIEVANFDPTSVRKTAQMAGIFTDARKRFENDLSSTLCDFAMKEITGLLVEVACPERPEGVEWEDIVDVYPQKPEERKLSFSVDKISKILGVEVSSMEVENILNKYAIDYINENGVFTITVPPLRLDLEIEEDMAEEIGRIMGYDKVSPQIPKIDFKPKADETYSKIISARNKLLADGYLEVMNYIFSNKGEVEVLESASDKKFLRTNLSDGLKESLKLNKLNAPLMGLSEVKIFEIGTVFTKDGEEIRVAYNDKEKVVESNLDVFVSKLDKNSSTFLQPSAGTFRRENLNPTFQAWSLFPFIARDVAVWVPETVESQKVLQVIEENKGDLVVRGPELFDEFKKDGKVSYAFRIIFQSYERTLTDSEVNQTIEKINKKIEENKDWKVR